jgi:polygalacturonase
MLNKVVFEDEITIWWDKEWDTEEVPVYRILCNGRCVGETGKTHFSMTGLPSETAYQVRVEQIKPVEKMVGEICVITGKEKRRIDVTKSPYNAVGDGKTLNTYALQRAFDDCGENECVYIPEGVFLSGALNMHSDMELYLEKGAVLQGTEEVEDYLPKRWSRFEGIEMMCYSSLLNMGELDHTAGYHCKNVVIRGGGVVSGGGQVLCDKIIATERELLKDFLAENAEYVKTCENEKTIPGRARPRLVNISNCQNVVLANVTFQYGPAWNVHFVYSENILTYGCKIISQGVWNGDGWNPDSSENCTIFDTEFYTHDDSIAIKSGKNPQGNIINRPTRNVRIFDCHGRNGISIGSEMSGGIEGVYIWDCNFTVAYGGFSIKITEKRGGYVRGIKVKDSAFTNVRILSVPWNNDGESAPTPPIVENIELKNVELSCVRTIAITGQRIPLPALTLVGIDNENYYLRNIVIDGLRIGKHDLGEPQQVVIKNVKGITLKNVRA